MELSGISDVIFQYLPELIVVILGSVVAELALSYYFKNKEKVKLRITRMQFKGRLGYSIETLNKTIMNARVRINEIECPWMHYDENEGMFLESTGDTTLYVGDRPSVILPYEAKALRRKLSGEDEVTFTIKEVVGQENTVYRNRFILKRDSKGELQIHTKEETSRHISSLVRVIGLGVEEVRDYSRRISLEPSLVIQVAEKNPSSEFDILIQYKGEPEGFVVRTETQGS